MSPPPPPRRPQTSNPTAAPLPPTGNTHRQYQSGPTQPAEGSRKFMLRRSSSRSKPKTMKFKRKYLAHMADTCLENHDKSLNFAYLVTLLGEASDDPDADV